MNSISNSGVLLLSVVFALKIGASVVSVFMCLGIYNKPTEKHRSVKKVLVAVIVFGALKHVEHAGFAGSPGSLQTDSHWSIGRLNKFCQSFGLRKQFQSIQFPVFRIFLRCRLNYPRLFLQKLAHH